MIRVKETTFYSEVIKEFNYPFGNIFIFDGFVVSEINNGVVLNWEDYGKLMVQDITCFSGTYGEDLIYISNRVNSYSVVAPDWLKFFKHNYSLKAYFVVSNNKIETLNSKIENLFLKDKIVRFDSLHTAINYMRSGLLDIA